MNRSLTPSRIALRLLASIMPFAFLGILLIGSFSYWLTRRYVLDSVKQDIESMGVDSAQRVANFFRYRENDLETVSETPLFSDFANNRDFGLSQEASAYRREISRYLERFAKRTAVYDGIWYVDARGREICRTENSLPFDVFQQSYDVPRFAYPGLPLTKGLFLSPVNESAEPVVFYAKALARPTGGPSEAIVLACGLAPVQKILSAFGSTRARRVFISNDPRTPMFPTDARALEQEASPPPYVSYTDIPNTPWKIATIVNLDDFLSPLQRIRNLTLVASFICLLLVAGLIYYRIQVLTRPIRSLKLATQRLAAGNLGERVKLTSLDEVGDLQRAFNTMAATLELDSIENANLLENVRLSQARYMTTVESSFDAILGLDENLRMVTWNRGARMLFGIQESAAIGQPFTILFPEADGARLAGQIRTDGFVKSYDVEVVGKTKEKRMLNLTCAGSSGPAEKSKEWSMVIRDITDQKRLQAQLIQAEKLSIVGQLISGIAHEINNPLGALAGYAELLISQNHDLSPTLKEELQFIYDNADRCREIVKNLLRFVRQEQLKKSAVNLNKLVRMGLRLLEHKIVHKEAINLVYDLDPNVPLVSVDPQQIEQVVVNLIYNACDALNGSDMRKEITLRTTAQTPYSIIEVSDNGSGIPDDMREKIFEPFFTTKGEGRGTGLGLAISRQIIQDHGGTISVHCTQNPARTTFTIRLPFVHGEESHGSDEPRRVFSRVPGKSVLIIDDRSDTTSLMHKLLQEEGDEVRVVKTAKEGAKRLGDTACDLVICALKGGTVSEIEILSALQARPVPPALLVVTGDLLSTQIIDEFRENGIHYLQKPFSLYEFRRTLRKILSGNPFDHARRGVPL